jgi:hypothetical protein
MPRNRRRPKPSAQWRRAEASASSKTMPWWPRLRQRPRSPLCSIEGSTAVGHTLAEIETANPTTASWLLLRLEALRRPRWAMESPISKLTAPLVGRPSPLLGARAVYRNGRECQGPSQRSRSVAPCSADGRSRGLFRRRPRSGLISLTREYKKGIVRQTAVCPCGCARQGSIWCPHSNGVR